MKVHIDLLGANDTQKARFASPHRAATLAAIRAAVGDPLAEIVVRWLPGHGREAAYCFVQTASKSPSFVTLQPFDGTTASNTLKAE